MSALLKSGSGRAGVSPSLTVGLAFLLGASVLWLLNILGRPSDGAERLDALDRRVARIEALHVASAFTAYPQGALCRTPPLQEAPRLQADLMDAARQSGAALVTASTAVQPPSDTSRAIDVAIVMDMNAAYPGVLKLMHTLAAYQPLVLVDRADLISKGSYVHLHLTGRVLCRT